MSEQGELNGDGLGYTVMRLVNREEPMTLEFTDGERSQLLYLDERGIRLDQMRGGFSIPLEDVLHERGYLSEAELLRSLADVLLTGQDLAKVLIERGRLDSETLEQARKSQVEEELLYLFGLTEGDFETESVDPGQALRERDPSIPEEFFDMDRLASLALDTAQDHDGVSREARNEREFFRADPDVIEKLVDSLNEESDSEAQVLSLLDGTLPLREVIQQTGLVKFKVFGIVDRHLARGTVSPVSTDDLKRSARQALEEEELVSALAFLRRAFERDRTDADVVEELAKLFALTGEKALAAAFFEFLGALHQHHDDHDAAASAWEQAANQDPDDLELHEKAFQYRFQTGSVHKAIASGLDLAQKALRAGRPTQTRAVFEKLVQEVPDDFTVRLKLFEWRVQERDGEEAMAQLREMERLTASGFPRGYDASVMTDAYQNMAALRPDDPDLAKKAEAAKPAAAPPPAAAPKRSPLVLGVVLLVAVVAGGAYFLLGPGSADPGGGQAGNGGQTKSPRPTPKADPRPGLLKRAEALFLEGESEKAKALYLEILEKSRAEDDLAKKAKEGLHALEEIINTRDVTAMIDAHEATLKEIREKVGGATRRETDAMTSRLEAMVTELDEIDLELPSELEDNVNALRDGIETLRGEIVNREFEIVLLKAQIEWDSRDGDTDEARRLFHQVIAGKPAQTILDKAHRGLEAIDAYMREAAELFQESKDRVTRSRNAKGVKRKVLLDDALADLKRIVSDYPKAPEVARVRYHIWIETEPAGATITVDGNAFERPTPALVTYARGTPPNIELSKDGFGSFRLKPNGSEATILVPLERRFLWTAQVSDAVDRGPAVFEGKLFLGCRDGGLYAYTFTQGKAARAWPPFKVRDIGGIKASPRVWGNRVILCSATLGELWALDGDSGKPVWGPIRPGRMIDHRPAGIPDTPFILFADVGGTLYAMRSDNGGVEWKSSVTGGAEGVRSAPAMFPSQGACFVGTTRGNVLKVSLKDGSVIWTVPTGLRVSVKTILCGNAVIAAVGSRLVAFDALSRETPAGPLWTAGPFVSPPAPAVTKNAIHLTDSSGTYFQLDPASGKTLFKAVFGPPGPSTVTPLIVGDTIVLTSGQVLSAWTVDVDTLKVSWKLAAPARINDPLIHHKGRVYLTTTEGHLCAALLEDK